MSRAWLFGCGGVGRGIGGVLEAAGWRVYGFDREVETAPDCVVDLACREETDHALSTVPAELTAPHAVIAAFGHVGQGTTAELTDQEVRALVNDNFVALVNLLWSLERGHHLRRAQAVYVVTSNAAFASRPDQEVYAAMKAAVASLVRSAAQRLGPDTAVVGLAPGTVMVNRNRERIGRTYPAAPLAPDRPGGRILEPGDLGELMLGTLSSASHLTGRTIIVDGGSSLT